MTKKEEVVHSRIPSKTKELMDFLIKRDNYASPSHFVRTAIEEKIKRDCGE